MAITLFKDNVVLSFNENALLIILLSKSKFILMSQNLNGSLLYSYALSSIGYFYDNHIIK